MSPLRSIGAATDKQEAKRRSGGSNKHLQPDGQEFPGKGEQRQREGNLINAFPPSNYHLSSSSIHSFI